MERCLVASGSLEAEQVDIKGKMNRDAKEKSGGDVRPLGRNALIKTAM